MACLLGCREVPRDRSAPRPRSNVIVVVVDMLRPDHLGVYGYPKRTSPNLDRMAREGIVFDRAYSGASWTYPSTVSLLTGLFPSEHGADDLSIDAATGALTLVQGPQSWLPRHFAASGYRTVGFHSHRYLERSVSNIYEAFEEYHYPPGELPAEGGGPAGSGWQGWNDRMFLDTLYPPFEQWLTENAGRPFFAYLHVIDVHGPYRDALVLEEDREEFERGVSGGSIDLPRMDEVDMYRPTDAASPHKAFLYDGHIGRTDRYLGRLASHLERLGIADATYLVVTSDHGEGFGEHGYWGHGANVFDPQVRVPLLFLGHRDLEGGPRRVAELVSTVGLLPTLAALVGVDLPAPAPSRAFTDLIAGSVGGSWRYFALAEVRRQGGHEAYMLGPRFKLVHESTGGRESFYDLATDPGELRPLDPADLTGEALAEYRTLSRTRSGYRLSLERRPVRETELSEEDLAALRALGYVH